jgi:hypothetical protein
MGGVFSIHFAMAVFCGRHLQWMNLIKENELKYPETCAS